MVNAEEQLLGCILQDKDSLYEIYNTVTVEMFTDNFNADCYRLMLGLYDLGQPITVVELAQRLDNREYSEQYALEKLTRFATCDSEVFNIKSYATTIVNKWKSTEMRKMVEKCDLTPKAINSTLNEFSLKIEQINALKQVSMKSIADIIAENSENYFKSDVGKNNLHIKLEQLDENLGGMQGGDVIVIAARPGVGKSAFALQIIEDVLRSGKKVGYFNLEMVESQVYERFVARHLSAGLTRLKRAVNFLGGEEAEFKKANELLSKCNLMVATGSKTVSEIKADCRHQNFDLIVIDYLQLVKTEKSYSNRANEVGDISKSIKALAMELKVPIIVLSQLNRRSDLADDKEPTMADIRESGDVEQDASVIILLWNMAEGIKGLKVDKNRQGVTMKTGLEFNGDVMTFKEIHKEWKDIKALAKDLNKGEIENDSCPFDEWG